MHSFVGFTSFNKNLSSPDNISIFKNLNSSLSPYNYDEKDLYISKHCCFSLIKTNNTESEIQIFSFNHGDNIYTIICNGRLYNANDIRKELINLGYEFERTFLRRSNIKSIYSLWKQYFQRV